MSSARSGGSTYTSLKHRMHLEAVAEERKAIEKKAAEAAARQVVWASTAPTALVSGLAQPPSQPDISEDFDPFEYVEEDDQAEIVKDEFSESKSAPLPALVSSGRSTSATSGEERSTPPPTPVSASTAIPSKEQVPRQGKMFEGMSECEKNHFNAQKKLWMEVRAKSVENPDGLAGSPPSASRKYNSYGQ